MLRVENPRVIDVFTNYCLGGARRAPKIDFGRVWGPFESPLGTSFGYVGGSVALLGHPWVQNGARNVNMRVLRAILAQVEVARGSQRLSGFDFETIFITSWVLFGIFVYFFGEKGFVHAVWYLDLDSCCVFFHFSMAVQHGCSVTLQLLFSMR